MKKLIAILMSLLVMPLVMASMGNTILELPLAEKNPTTWVEIADGDCNGLDYTGDNMVNHRDRSFVRRNKIDANGDLVYNNDDLKFMEENYANCRAGKGTVTFTEITKHGKTIQERVRVSVWNLNPMTEYQLIYYGDETHNDVWSYATCIGRARKTSTQGYFKGSSATFEFLDFLSDTIPQKFWVVLASDVDCEDGIMTAWNPTEYLFEHNVI